MWYQLIMWTRAMRCFLAHHTDAPVAPTHVATPGLVAPATD